MVTSASAQVSLDDPPVAAKALIGLDPLAVRARLASMAARWPIHADLLVVDPRGGVLTFISAQTLFSDPALAERMARFEDHQTNPKDNGYIACETQLTGPGPQSDGAPVFEFTDGKLMQVLVSPVRPPSPLAPKPLTLTELIKRPVVSPFLDHPGALPLEDGLGFLARWNMRAVDPNGLIRTDCKTFPPVSSPKVAVRRRGLDASDMQGLALLPFAAELPLINAQREAARQSGAVTLQALTVGGRLGMTPERFAESHKGVRVYRGGPPGYAVLTIDLGAFPSNTLGRFDRAAMAGVRGDTVEWVQPGAGGLGLSASLLCLDARNVPSRARQGCNEFGRFAP